MLEVKGNFSWGLVNKQEDEDSEEEEERLKKEKEQKEGDPKEEKRKLWEEKKRAEAKKPKVLKTKIHLREIDLSIMEGEFVCIIGSVGSGKSSLLSTVIGDMIYSKDSFVNKEDPTASDHTTAPISISQSISYSQQIPWI